MKSTTTLLDKYNYYSEDNEFDNIISAHKYIQANLNHKLRDYQIEAISRFIHFYEKNEQKKAKRQDFNNYVLFEMATGSGKTMLMAGLMLYLRKQGYDTFIYWVPRTALVNQTEAIFTGKLSQKQLFKNYNIVEISGKQIDIVKTNEISPNTNDNINIYFNTIQGNLDISKILSENTMQLDDFKNKKVAIFVDESHHFNAGSKNKKNALGAYEKIVNDCFKAHKDNVLIELTATAELDNQKIAEKYSDKLIMRYDLKEFTKNKYAKSISMLKSSDTITDEQRMLIALLCSQYRLSIANKYKIKGIKPIILFKSARIAQSKDNHKKFVTLINELNTNKIDQIISIMEENQKENIIKNAVAFVKQNKATIVNDIKEDFNEKNIIDVNIENNVVRNSISKSAQEKDAEEAIELNKLTDLDEPNNRCRAVFAVDKLNEGWDVLNLFDIVKLYKAQNADTADTTTQEKQLIGRGARYRYFDLPKELANDPSFETDKFKRKCNENSTSDLVFVEQIHYHSLNEVDFLGKLKEQLENEGYDVYDTKEYEQVNLTEPFLISNIYSDGIIYTNDKELVETLYKLPNVEQDDKPQAPNLDSMLKNNIDKYELIGLKPIEKSYDISRNIEDKEMITTNDDDTQQNNTFTSLRITINDEIIEFNLFYSAVSHINMLNFDIISKYIKDITSIKELKKSLTNVAITFRSSKENITNIKQIPRKYLFNAITDTMIEFSNQFDEEIKRYKGTTSFTKANPIKKVFEKSISIAKPENKDNIISFDNLLAYDKFIGNKDEIKLIERITSVIGAYKEKCQEMWLIRNDIKVKFYNFDDGAGFAPDFILMIKKNESKILNAQIIIESKGEHLAEYDKWKQLFLEDTCQLDNPTLDLKMPKTQINITLPFYINKNTTQNNEFVNETTFLKILKEKINKFLQEA